MPDVDPPDADRPPSQWVLDAPPSPSYRSLGGSVLAAAMLAVGEILEPEKTEVIIEQASDDPFGDADLRLSFDGLPPLDG